jgi:adenylate cyclase class IV
MLVVEVYKLISKPSLKPLKVLEDGKKVIYVKQRDIKIEKEIKFPVNDVNTILEKINKENVAKFFKTEYIRDIIYGSTNNNRKIRLRLQNNFENLLVEAIYKHKIEDADNAKVEVEEIIYKGNQIKDALIAIKNQGDFKEENSYEKIRSVFLGDKVEITLDIYPFGIWLEIEGEVEKIWEVAEKLGYKKEDGSSLNADELYLQWSKKHGLKEFWDVRFGLTGKK